MLRWIVKAATIGNIFFGSNFASDQFDGIVLRLVKIIIYSIVAALLIVAILFCTAFLLHAELIRYGLEPHLALMIILISALVLAVALLFKIIQQIKDLCKLRTASRIKNTSQNWPNVSKIVRAFADGFARQKI